jgi:hypothetical protein
MEMALPELDLQRKLLDLCEVLEIIRAPSIAWVNRKEIHADGVYCRNTHRISISSTVPDEAIAALIVHELCHAVLQQAGYRSAGHSAIFMATNRLMLLKAGLQDSESVEGIASRNWNKWTPWPYWYRHILEAQHICESLSSKEGFVESSNAQAIACSAIEMKAYKKSTPKWVVYRWHEIIADTRGPWFALQDVCRVLFLISVLLILSPYSVLRQMGLASFGLCVVGMLLFNRKFKQK